MRKRYVPDSRWLIYSAVLAGVVALLIVSLARLPLLRSVPTSQTLPLQETPTRSTQALVVFTPLVTSTALAPPTATFVPVIATTVSDVATPVIVVEAVPTDTAEPIALLPEPEIQTVEPTPAPTDPPMVPTVAPIAPTQPPIAKPAPTTAAAKPVPTKKPDPNVLPNGVRYGDHKPNLPGRVVRVASPNIKLDTSVYEVYIKKNAWEVADYAAGHNYNSPNPGEGGNIVLSGHNNWRGEVFRYLEDSKVGDIIQVWTQEGKEYDYRVTEIKKLKEAGVSMAQRLKNATVMNPTDHEQLTLITCWPYTTFTHRLILIATPVN